MFQIAGTNHGCYEKFSLLCFNLGTNYEGLYNECHVSVVILCVSYEQ